VAVIFGINLLETATMYSTTTTTLSQGAGQASMPLRKKLN